MKLYSVKINLAGSLLNQVRKEHVTAAEIVLLRSVHGNDAVTEIKHVANVNRSDRAERARLAKLYTKTSPQGVKRGDALVREFLGLESTPLPDDPPVVESAVKADEFETVVEDAEEIVPLNVEPIKRVDLSARRAARSAAAELTG